MRGRRWLAPGAGFTFAIAAAVAPKCPVCVGAYLSILGVGLGTAGAVASLLRPTLLALSVAILGAWLVWRGTRYRARRRKPAH